MAKSEPIAARRLPSGKHGMTPEAVAANQRRRILKALSEVMSAKGYSETSITDIVKHARVSRPTFYSFFDSKQDCFMAGYAHVQQHIVDDILAAPTSGTPMERFDELLQRYLTALASDPATSRLYLVYAYEAGPDAIRRRLVMQRRFVDGVIAVFKARSKADRFACAALVAAISTLVTHALFDDDETTIPALRKPLLDIAARLMTRPQ